jgi:hypothetical protein
MTYTLIAHQELASTQSAIIFSSIPATFTDLLVVASLRANGTLAFVDGQLRFNGSTSGYSFRNLYGTGSSAASGSGTTESHFFDTNAGRGSSNTFASVQIYIPNYRTSNNKSFSSDSVEEANGTSAFQGIHAGLWSDSAAINSIGLYDSNGNSWVQFSSATLYGITAGSSGGVVVS